MVSKLCIVILTVSLQARLGLKVKCTVCEKIHKKGLLYPCYILIYMFWRDALVGWGFFVRANQASVCLGPHLD